MAQIASLSYSSPFYALLQGALQSAGFKGDIQSFLLDDFWQTVMPVAKWKQFYSLGNENTTGEVRQYFGTNRVPVMASYTSENAEGHLIANKGFSVTQKEMPTASLSYKYDNDSFRKGQELMDALAVDMSGAYANIFQSFVEDTSSLIQGFDSLRSYTGLQVESTGKYIADATNNPGGIQGIMFDFTEHAPNFTQNEKLTGHFAEEDTAYTIQGKTYPWSNANSSPIGDLMDMAHAYKYIKHGDLRSAVFRMSDTTANIFYNNANVKREVRLNMQGADADPTNLDAIRVSEADVNAYLTKLGLPTIEVEDLRSAVQVLNPETKLLEEQLLCGFADDVVLLRPKGVFGHYDWQRVSNLAATNINPLFYAENSLIGIQQLTNTAGGEIRFNGKSKGIPVPDNINMFLYLDIATEQTT